MAKNMSRVPGILVVTLGASDVTTQITFPNNTRKVSVYFETDPGKVAYEGTDGAAIDAAHAPILPNAWFRFDVDPDQIAGAKGPVAVYLATVAGTTTVRVWAESS